MRAFLECLSSDMGGDSRDVDSIIDIRDGKGWEKMFKQFDMLTKSKSESSSPRESLM